MNPESPSPLVRISLEAAKLMREHPSKIRHRIKQIVFDVAALLQMLAAHLAEIQTLVFHTVDAEGMAALNEAQSIFERDILSSGEPKRTSDLL